MINQKESKQVRVGSGLAKILSKDKKTKAKNRDQAKNNHQNKRKIKNNRKIKAMGNITPTMDHYLRNEQMIDADP